MPDLYHAIREILCDYAGQDAASRGESSLNVTIGRLVDLFGTELACPDCRWRKIVAGQREFDRARQDYESAVHAQFREPVSGRVNP